MIPRRSLDSSLTQHLDALLLVAEQLEGKLSKDHAPKQEKQDLTKLFVRTKGDTVSFEKKTLLSWIDRLLQPSEIYDIEISFGKLNRLFETIKDVAKEDLQRALQELQAKGKHKEIQDPVNSLLMCKYRLNAILKHATKKQENDDILGTLKISWVPTGSVNWAKKIHAAATPAEPDLAAKPKKSALLKADRTIEWAKEQEGVSLENLLQSKKASKLYSEPKVLKRLVYEFALVVLRGAGNEKEAVTALKKLNSGQKKQIIALCDDEHFIKEFRTLLTISDDEWKLLVDQLRRL